MLPPGDVKLSMKQDKFVPILLSATQYTCRLLTLIKKSPPPLALENTLEVKVESHFGVMLLHPLIFPS